LARTGSVPRDHAVCSARPPAHLGGDHLDTPVACGRRTGAPLGWATTRGLLAWIDRDHSLATALDAITEPAITIEPSATVREAVALIGREHVDRLLVSHTAHAMPEGVVAELDLLGV